MKRPVAASIMKRPTAYCVCDIVSPDSHSPHGYSSLFSTPSNLSIELEAIMDGSVEDVIQLTTIMDGTTTTDTSIVTELAATQVVNTRR